MRKHDSDFHEPRIHSPNLDSNASAPAVTPAVSSLNQRPSAPLTDRDWWLQRQIEAYHPLLANAIRHLAPEHELNYILGGVWYEFSLQDAGIWDEKKKLAWLTEIAKRAAATFYRKEKGEADRVQAVGSAGHIDGLIPVDLTQANGRDAARYRGRDAEDDLAREAMAERLDGLKVKIKGLPAVQIALLVDYKLAKRSATEIAERRGLSRGEVHRAMAKAIKSLKS